MNKYDTENEIYWEVNFFDTKNKLEDFYGNTADESHIEILKEKALNKGYDVVEVIKVTKEITRYNKK
jgi:alpha-amylase/alpha-mannosidase (GH57 family)